jgi:Tfp pilus assembly protein PilV
MAASPAPHPSRAGEAGFSVIEVLVSSVVIAIACIGVALMFSTGQTYVNAEGDNRVGLFLAQQRIEQVRAAGYSSLISSPPSSSPEAVPNHAGYSRTVTVECVPRDDYSAAAITCVSGTTAVRIGVTVSVTPADGKSPPVTIQSMLAPR